MSKRGIRRTSMRARLAVAAAVLVGGGAAGVVAVSATHNDSSASAESAGYSQTTGRTLSYTSALSSAMNSWDKSPNASLMTISHMKPITNYWTQSWHRTVIFIQRGTVVAVGRGEFAVESANRTIEIWHVNGGTTTDNVGGTATGMSAMTGGSMKVPASWKMNTKVKGIAKGDLVFIFGERENHTLKAQLVLFAAPTAVRAVPRVTPTATVTATATAKPTATTAVIPAATATATTTAPVVAPTAVSGTHS